MNRWLKHKTETSGWPAHCLTEDQKAAYIRDYKEHEGIQLEAKTYLCKARQAYLHRFYRVRTIQTPYVRFPL